MADYNVGELVSKALAEGFTRAGELNTDALIFRPEVRDMCAADKCRSYGRNWRCPPACGEIEEIAKKVKNYGFGIILQTVGHLEDEFDGETIMDTGRLHNENFRKLMRKLKAEYPDILPMGAGTCTNCKKCGYPDEPCRFPDDSYTSMEAYGLWVSDVCEKSGVPYNSGKLTITYTSCFLLP